jgi:capsular exopolysaccharide synthesis family protein
VSRIDEALRRTKPGERESPRSVPAAAAPPASGQDTEDGTGDPWHVSAEAAPAPAATAQAQPDDPVVDPWNVPPEASAPEKAPADVLDRPAPVPGASQDLRRSKIYEKLNAEQSNLPSAVVEQYRRLAASLHHAQLDRGIKTVMICSALGGEGKSLTATNLALTLSESYRRRVLLVDGDLRRPSLNKVFDLPELPGLADGLSADDDRRLPVAQLSTYLTLLPAGRPTPDPMASLTSNRMKQIISEAREAFDWVIVDTPPIALLTDASLLGSMVDTTVLVVRVAHTPLAAVKKALDVLGRNRVMGVVLNRGAAHAHSSHYSAYYSGYSS